MTAEELALIEKNVLAWFEKHTPPTQLLEHYLCMILGKIHTTMDMSRGADHTGLIKDYYKNTVQKDFPVGEERFRILTNSSYMASLCHKGLPPLPVFISKPVSTTPSELDVFRARNRYLKEFELIGMGNPELAEDIMGRFRSK